MISVIVPIYNIENHLSKCLYSILNQTYKDFELILVDDGSTDTSGAICDEFAEKDNRITVIHKENGGVSSARNEGLSYARGEYITFVDGDDFVNDRMLEILLKNAQEHNCDISCCQLQTVYDNGTKTKSFANKSGVIPKEKIIENYFFDAFTKEIMYSQCNKIFKKELLLNIYYKDYKYGEDILFVFEALSKSNGIYYDDYIGYLYLRREDSAMATKFNANRIDYINAAREIEAICKKDFPFAYNNARKWVFLHSLNTCRNISTYNLKKANIVWFSNEIQYLKDTYKSVNIPIKNKIDYFALRYFPVYFKLIIFMKRILKP